MIGIETEHGQHGQSQKQWGESPIVLTTIYPLPEEKTNLNNNNNNKNTNPKTNKQNKTKTPTISSSRIGQGWSVCLSLRAGMSRNSLSGLSKAPLSVYHHSQDWTYFLDLSMALTLFLSCK